jgi:predicted ATPase
VGPDRAGERRGLTPPPLDGDGAAAQAIALADPALLERVSLWYQEHCGATLARAAHGPEADRFVLRRADRADLPFPDAGEGLQQAFAVLVGAEQLRARGGLLAVEEPEVSLHPRLQRALADRFVEVARAQPEAQVLLETHSEVMLLSALHAAVEHRVNVRLHWVEAGAGGGARVREVALDAEGRPRDTTLTDAFDTMGVQRRALIDARRQRAAGAPRGGAGVG